jgi:GTP cyclohydrolase I
MEDLIRQILVDIGEDPEREGLLRTPTRVSKALSYLTKGYEQNLEDVVNGAIFAEDHNEMVVCKDVDFFSLCEHHMLPFFGRAHVAYIPNGRIVGLSKLARVVEMFSRRLQVQERLTVQIARTLNDVLEPQGVAVVLEATHLCMVMRGVEKQNSSTITSSMLGVFNENPATRAEFFSLIRHRGQLGLG